jgi:hypothetical protein
MIIKTYSTEGRIFQLEIQLVEMGWPDEGHEEYVLVELTKRKSNFWQKILGDKRTNTFGYGEDKPSEESINKFIEQQKSKNV